MSAHPPELTQVTAVLRRAQSRRRAMLVGGAILWAGSSGLLALVALQALRLLWPQVWAAWFGDATFPITTAWIVCGAAAVTLAVLLPLALIRTPTLLSLAKAADERFGLQERLSTALELTAARSGPQSAVRAALFTDVAREARALDPKVLVPVTIPKLGWTMPFLAGGAILLGFLPTPPMPPVAAGAQPALAVYGDRAMSREEQEAVAAQIERVSKLAAERAEEHADPLMQAVARTLESLADRVRSDGSFERGEILSVLQDMAAYAAQEAQTGQGQDGISALLEAAARQIAPNMVAFGSTDARSTGERASVPTARAEGENDSVATPQTTQGAKQVAEQGRQGTKKGLVEDELTKLSSSDAGIESGASGGEGTPTTASSNNYSMVERHALRQTQRADMVGDFEQSRDGNFSNPMDNPWGGETTRENDSVPGAAEEASAPDVAFGTNAELMLEAREIGEGRRVRRDTPPVARFTPVEDRASATGNPAWIRQDEVEVSRSYLGPDLRDFVSAYFMSRTRQVGE